MKRAWIVFSAVLLWGVFAPSASADTDIDVFINGNLKTLSQPPILLNDEPYVPMKEVFEAFDASVVWDKESNDVTSVYPGIQVELDLDTLRAVIKHEDRAEDTILQEAAEVVQGRAMIPLDVIEESFNADVAYNEELRYILINTIKPEQEKQLETPGLGIYAAGRTYAEFLSFLIEESTETALKMTSEQIETLVQHSPDFFARERSTISLAKYAKNASVTDIINQEDSSAVKEILNLGFFKAEQIERKDIGSSQQLTVIRGVYTDHEQTKGLVYYFGEVNVEEGDLIGLTGIAVGKSVMTVELEENDEQYDLIVTIAGNLYIQEGDESESQQQSDDEGMKQNVRLGENETADR